MPHLPRVLGRAFRRVLGTLSPSQAERLTQRLRRLVRPVRLGAFGRTHPVSAEWGFDRGTPIDRWYIEAFLAEHRRDVRGRVLEVRNSLYTERFGNGVERGDVLDIDRQNSSATLIADLSAADDLASDQFDCFILTQTLQFIFDVQSAVAHTHRILRPGGVALVTLPSVSRVAPRGGLTNEYWRFTAASCAALFGSVFGVDQIQITSYGNVSSAIAFLAGMAREELSPQQLDGHDEYFPLLLAVRAVKRSS